MPPRRPGYSFEIQSAVDLFWACCDAIDEYLGDRLSSWKAVSCAMLTWHLADWVAGEYPEKAGTLRELQDQLRRECPALAHMQAVATGTKHLTINRFPPSVKSAEAHHGSFDQGFDRGFDTSALKLILQDGTVAYFDEEVVKARDYWRSFLINQLGIAGARLDAASPMLS